MKYYQYIFITFLILIILYIIYTTGWFGFRGLIAEYKVNNNLFQIVTPEYLNTINKKNYREISELFEIEYIIDKTYKKNIISVALFCQDKNNSFKDEKPSIINDIGSSWYKTYFDRLLKVIKDFNKSTYKQEWGIRLYLEPLLTQYIPQLQDRNVEIYVMKNNSIGSQPGMLWRFLTADDKDLEAMISCDVDENFYDFAIWLEDIQICKKLYPDKKMMRLVMPYYKLGLDFYKIDKEDNALNVQTAMGGRFAFFPNRSNLVWKDLIIKYMCLRFERLEKKNKHLDYDYYTNDSPHKKVIAKDDFGLGWGGHPYKYGFDEKFLKVVIFPYFAKRGEIITIVNEKNEIENMLKTKPTGDSYFKIEYDYYSYYKNVYYVPKRIKEQA